jgi:hypothetical protein
VFIIEYITIAEEGIMLIIVAFFMLAIFINTQSASPIFFSNDDYLGWGKLFNMFWLVLVLLCFVKSYFAGINAGLFGSKGVK